jgi:hypothetical protein
MAAALFGERGLALHIALVSMHGLILLSLLTVLVETDLARAHGGRTRWQTLRSTLRNTLIHPVMLPVLLGLAFQLSGLHLHPVLDLTLQGLGSAVVPLCLVLIGVSLAAYGVQGRLLAAMQWSLLKLLVLPTAVLLVAHRASACRAAAGGAGDDGRAAGGQQRADLCAALRRAAGRVLVGPRDQHGGLCRHQHAVAGRAGGDGVVGGLRESVCVPLSRQREGVGRGDARLVWSAAPARRNPLPDFYNLAWRTVDFERDGPAAPYERTRGLNLA